MSITGAGLIVKNAELLRHEAIDDYSRNHDRLSFELGGRELTLARGFKGCGAQRRMPVDDFSCGHISIQVNQNVYPHCTGSVRGMRHSCRHSTVRRAQKKSRSRLLPRAAFRCTVGIDPWL